MVFPLLAALGPIITAVSGFLASAGTAISTFGGALLAKLPQVLSAVDKVLRLVQPIAEIFKVLSPGEDMEELGAKACQADKTPENFDSNAAYITYLRNDVELDQDAFDKRGNAERFAHKAAGVALVSKGIEEKSGIEIIPEFWAEASRLSLNASEVTKLIDAFSATGSTRGFVDYLQGSLSPKEKGPAGEQIRNVFGEIYSDLNESEVAGKVQDMCAATRNNEWKEKE